MGAVWSFPIQQSHVFPLHSFGLMQIHQEVVKKKKENHKDQEIAIMRKETMK